MSDLELYGDKWIFAVYDQYVKDDYCDEDFFGGIVCGQKWGTRPPYLGQPNIYIFTQRRTALKEIE